jgi:hypothetical protein
VRNYLIALLWVSAATLAMTADALAKVMLGGVD